MARGLSCEAVFRAGSDDCLWTVSLGFGMLLRSTCFPRGDHAQRPHCGHHGRRPRVCQLEHPARPSRILFHGQHSLYQLPGRRSRRRIALSRRPVPLQTAVGEHGRKWPPGWNQSSRQRALGCRRFDTREQVSSGGINRSREAFERPEERDIREHLERFRPCAGVDIRRNVNFCEGRGWHENSRLLDSESGSQALSTD